MWMDLPKQRLRVRKEQRLGAGGGRGMAAGNCWGGRGHEMTQLFEAC